jgi:predicted phage-related endonuclease
VFLPNRRKETVTYLAFTAYTLTEKLLTAFLGVFYEAIMYKYTEIRRSVTYATGCEKEIHGRIKENRKDQIN